MLLPFKYTEPLLLCPMPSSHDFDFPGTSLCLEARLGLAAPLLSTPISAPITLCCNGIHAGLYPTLQDLELKGQRALLGTLPLQAGV